MTEELHPLVAHARRLRVALDEFDGIAAALDQAADVLAAALSARSLVMVAGNGGSAAEAQHLAGEFIGRLAADRERGALPAVALSADAATLTALGNDYGFEQIFARQVSGLGREGDVLVVLSTSGASENLVSAVREAKARGVRTIGLLGATRRALHDACDVVIAAPATTTATIQECHLALIHVLVHQVEERLTTGAR